MTDEPDAKAGLGVPHVFPRWFSLDIECRHGFIRTRRASITLRREL